MRDPVGHRAGLSAARAGENKKWSIGMENGFPLPRVEMIQVEFAHGIKMTLVEGTVSGKTLRKYIFRV